MCDRCEFHRASPGNPAINANNEAARPQPLRCCRTGQEAN
jgi:hypothetical protein